MFNTEGLNKGINGVTTKIMEILHFWKDWPIEAQIMLLIGVIFALLSWIILTFAMKIHGLDWKSANTEEEE